MNLGDARKVSDYGGVTEGMGYYNKKLITIQGNNKKEEEHTTGIFKFQPAESRAIQRFNQIKTKIVTNLSSFLQPQIIRNLELYRFICKQVNTQPKSNRNVNNLFKICNYDDYLDNAFEKEELIPFQTRQNRCCSVKIKLFGGYCKKQNILRFFKFKTKNRSVFKQNLLTLQSLSIIQKKIARMRFKNKLKEQQKKESERLHQQMLLESKKKIVINSKQSKIIKINPKQQKEENHQKYIDEIKKPFLPVIDKFSNSIILDVIKKNKQYNNTSFQEQPQQHDFISKQKSLQKINEYENDEIKEKFNKQKSKLQLKSQNYFQQINFVQSKNTYLEYLKNKKEVQNNTSELCHHNPYLIHKSVSLKQLYKHKNTQNKDYESNENIDELVKKMQQKLNLINQKQNQLNQSQKTIVKVHVAREKPND